MTKFLTAKHWQLFGLFFGVPIVMEGIAVTSIFSSHDPTAMVYLFSAMMILFTGLFFGWFYALGTNLYKKLPASVSMNVTKFKVFLLVPAVYIFFLSIFMFGTFSNSSPGERMDFGAVAALIVPLHLFSMFCIFYCLYFNAKALKAVEWQRPVTFSDFAGEFFLIWFFPIGVWIIQPRINKLFDITAEDQQALDNFLQ